MYRENFKKAIESITNKSFENSLNDFDLLSIVQDCNSQCICKHKIANIFQIQHIRSKTKYNIGYCCAQNFYDAFIEQNQHDVSMTMKIEEFRKLWEELQWKYKYLKKKHVQCKKCKSPWTHNRCFYKGLCTDCRDDLKDLLSTKIVLNKYYGKTLKDMSDDIDYMNFCIKNKTRQSDLFKEYITFC
ncbi:TPA_asm: hypothetical protein [Monosiga MELD virus 2]|nr:TPA_asm: hypothetical protein [Monosiga MELD virus 2]